MKKIFIIIIIVAAALKLWKSTPEGVPPTEAIENGYRCIRMQGYRGDPNWSVAQGDGWHDGLVLKNVGVMSYSIPYRARISQFRFERKGEVKTPSGPAKDGVYYRVRISRRIERTYNPGNVDSASLEQILPRSEVLERDVFFYKYLNGTWRSTEQI